MRGNYIQFFDKKIIIVGKDDKPKSTLHFLKADYLIVRDVKEKESMMLRDRYRAGLVILNSGIKGLKARNIEKIFADSNIPVYSIDKDGAWSEGIQH